MSNKEKYEKYLTNFKVLELVCSVPGYGEVRAVRVIKDLGINACKRIGGLGKKQKERFYRYFNIYDSAEV